MTDDNSSHLIDHGYSVPATQDNIQEVMYDYDANETDELSIKQMEMLVIIERDNTDWWKARKGKRIGYVPTTYIKQPKAGVYAEVISGEADIQEGEIVEVVNTVYANIWTVIFNGRVQTISSNCIRILDTTRRKTKAAPSLPALSEYEPVGIYSESDFNKEQEKRKSQDGIKSPTSFEYESLFSNSTSVYDMEQPGAMANSGEYDELTPDLMSNVYEPIGDFGYENDRQLRIVMVGKTGAGKSSTANSILQSNTFVARACGQSVTRKCQRGDDHRVSVVDTPGLFDTKLSKDEIRDNILNCIHKTVPGPHLFLIVIQIGRFTSEEILALDNLFEIFGNSMEVYSILVFTRFDDLQRDGISIDQYIEESGEPLQTYVKKCSKRYFAMNNVAQGQQKETMVERFMQLMTDVAKQNKWKPYSHEMIQEAKKNVQPLLKNLREEKDFLNKQEIKDIESHYAAVKETLNKKRKELLANIRTCSEERDRLLEDKRRALATFLQKNASLDSAESSEDMAERQREINEVEKRLQETYKDIEEHGIKQKELETEYVKINQRRKEKVLSTNKKHHEKMIRELRNFTDEHFNKIDIMIAGISLIDQQIDGVNRELDTVSSKADKRRLTVRKYELMKEREKASKENATYLERMLDKSNDLRNQLSKKEKFCRIM